MRSYAHSACVYTVEQSTHIMVSEGSINDVITLYGSHCTRLLLTLQHLNYHIYK